MGEFWDGLKPLFLMVVLQAQVAGMSILYRMAIADGINIQVLIAYRLMFAAAFMLPLAFFLERKTRPKLTWTILTETFFTGLLGGSLPLNLGIKAMALTSATFTAAMGNIRPVLTFIISIFFGLETLGIRTRRGQAKVLGTCLGIGGGLLLTFYKGPVISFWETNVNLLDLVRHHNDETTSVTHDSTSGGNTVLGGLLCLGGALSSALWLILQTKMSNKYPSCHYSTSAMLCVMAAIQSVVFTVCTETDSSQWKLNNAVRLLTASYSGIVSFGLSTVITSWCAYKRGPLFVANFSPLSAIAVAIAANLLLDEKLHLGSALGGILIICGLYVMMWGKNKEMKKKNVNEETFPPKSTQNSEETTRPSITSDNVSITVVGNGNDSRPIHQHKTKTEMMDDGPTVLKSKPRVAY